jgi:PASTA domain
VAALLAARFWRFALPATALLLATGGLTSAASNQQAASRPTLVVPKVSGQAYVFAKGILADSGFGWKVVGGVNGFAANFVTSQSPAAGTRVIDTGAPTITLRLERNAKYAEDGVPENFSPFPGTRVLKPGAATPRATKPAARPKSSRPAATRPKASRPAAKPKATRRATKPKTAAPKTTRRTAKPKTPAPKAAKPKSTPRVKKAAARPVAFTVPGAPKEPVNEMPLPRRARLLQAWLRTHTRPTDANVDHWQYQHAWIVTGAKFGWWRGAQALRILVAVDRRVISSWGIGTRSLATARAALAEVEAKRR